MAGAYGTNLALSERQFEMAFSSLAPSEIGLPDGAFIGVLVPNHECPN